MAAGFAPGGAAMQASEHRSLSRYLRQPIAMTAWKRCECAGDNLSARAILAYGRVVARSDEALEAVAAARARGGEFAHREHRLAVP